MTAHAVLRSSPWPQERPRSPRPTRSDHDAATRSHPSPLRRPGCWIAFLTIIPLLIGAAYVLTNWAGARHLAQTKAELAAAGIELNNKLPVTL